MEQTDPVKRADAVKIAHRQLQIEICEISHTHAPEPDATVATTAPALDATAATIARAPAAGGGDDVSDAELLELARRIEVQLTRLSDIADGVSKSKDP